MMSAGRKVTLSTLAFNLGLFSTVSRAFGCFKTERKVRKVKAILVTGSEDP
jgi:hypothetical protein